MSWNPPPIGSEERNKMPKDAFLDPENKLYPYKEKVNGKWVVSVEGLRAAISVANMQGNTKISKKASKLLSKYHEENSVGDVMEVNETTALRYRIAKNLYMNEKGESEALEGYAKLLKDLTEWHLLTDDSTVKSIILRAIDHVREISSDEKNHRLILQSLQNDIDKIEITPDGMSAALENIVGMVSDSD